MPKYKTLIIILITVGFLAYLPSLFGGFIWDDEDTVYANRYVTHFEIGNAFTHDLSAGRGKVSNYYRPLQLTLNALLYRIAGAAPFIFHLASIVIHIAAAVMIFMVLSNLLQEHAVPFLASFVFLVHPVQAESVSYISAMPEPLYTLFFFAAILLFLKRETHSCYFPLSLFLFILSLLSKELAVLLPAILFLMSLFFRRGMIKKDLPLIFLYGLIALLFLVARFTFLQFGSGNSIYWTNSPYTSHVFIRTATFFRLFFSYISLFLFPKDLYMERDYNVQIPLTLFNIGTILFIAVNLLLIVILLAKKKNRPRTPLFFWLAFLVSVTPYTGVFLLNGIFYEHHLYFPLVFFFGFVFSMMKPMLRGKAAWYIIMCILCLFSVRSYIRQFDWIDNERFYRQALRYVPQSYKNINGLGVTLMGKGQYEEAIGIFNRGVRLNPKEPTLYHNIASCYFALGNTKKAEEYYRLALKTEPRFIWSEEMLLKLYVDTSQKEKAKALIENSVFSASYRENPEINKLLK